MVKIQSVFPSMGIIWTKGVMLALSAVIRTEKDSCCFSYKIQNP